MKPTATALLIFFLAGCASVPRVPEGQLVPQTAHRAVETRHTVPHLVYLPEGYHADTRAWPLVLFLHGAGERGDDLDLVKVHGPPKHIEAGESFPFILLAPQAPPDSWWSLDGLEALGALLDAAADRYRVDLDRVYVTGLSMGGFGTWALAERFPNRFAAIAPICGGGEPYHRLASRLRHTPTWAFHGAKDEVVPLRRSEEMVAAVEASGGTVRFTVYPEAGHDAWTETYANPELYAWLLSHRRSAAR